MVQPTPTAPPITRSHTIAITLGATVAVVMVIACLLNMAHRNRKFPFSRKTNYDLKNNTTKGSNNNAYMVSKPSAVYFLFSLQLQCMFYITE